MSSKVASSNRFGVLAFPKHHREGDKSPNIQNEQCVELLKGTQSRTPHDNSKIDYINFGHEDQMEINGYADDPFKRFVTIFFMIITLGALRLFYHWYPHLYVKSVNRRVPLKDAQRLLIVEKYQDKHISYHVKELKVLTPQEIIDYEKKSKQNSSENLNKSQDISLEIPITLSLHLGGGHFKHVANIRMFTCKKVVYIWDKDSEKFVKLKGLDVDITSDLFHESKPLSEQEQQRRRLVYGSNSINVPEQSILSLLFLEVLNPFYIFQAASFLLWFSDSYYAYAAAILILSVFGIIMSIVQTRRNQRNLKSTVHSSDIATVLRSAKINLEDVVISKTMSTEKLVPGDIMEIPAHGCVMHCDAVLLTGNCILNEAMLTGESVPVTKTPIPNLANLSYDTKEHSRHTLYCGTRIIQTRYLGDEKVLAVVIRTGFSTAKGGLVRSILYPPPVDFRFEKDSYRFIGLLAFIAGGGFIFTVVSKALRGVSVTAILVQALDLITIVVPPALPAAMTVGRMYAQRRLQKKNIFCISPRTINVAGSIDCVCFDKTGTLTEDGLDMLYVVPIVHKYFQIPIREISKMVYDKFMFGIVTCHSITLIDGKMRGDPLDLKMFESTEWMLEEPNIADNSKFDMIFPTVVKPPVCRRHENVNIAQDNVQKQNGKKKSSNVDLEIGILREFPFSSTLQRMSVIVRRLGASHYECFCKGSPEMVLTLVKSETVPENFSEVLESYTQQGYRVLALAYKELSKMSYPKIQRASRELIETDMELLGLIVMENRLKPETAPVINMLNEAKIRTIMITGDNLLTALSVARECDIITNDQTILTINTYIPDDRSSSPELYFVVNSSNGFSSKPTQNKNHTILNIGCEDYSILSNEVDSSSVVSLDTTESCTINTEVTASGQYEIPNKMFEGSFTSSSYRFAITGKTWTILRKYFPDVIPKVVTRGVVFARMSPDQKQMLVQELQSLGYYVAMVGDGANDVGALRTAHCGISLSDTEASVASPFTSKTANITAITNVISQGRAALVTSFSIFKYMAAYSITQFISVMLLYSIDSNLTDIEFLYIDLFIITTFAYYFGKTEAYTKRLVPERPLNSLIGFTPVLSLVIQLILVGLFQIVAFYHLLRQEWYHPQENPSHEAASGCWENYTVFTISSFQYIVLAVVYSKGKPHRKPMWTNRGFVISTIVLTVFSIYLTLGPCPFLTNFFELVLPPRHWNASTDSAELNVSFALNDTNIFDFVPSQIYTDTENVTLASNQTDTTFDFENLDFRFVLLGYACLNFLLALFFESFVVDYVVAKILRLKFHNVNTSKKRFLQIDDELKRDGTWPQINETYSGGFQSPNAQPDSLTSGFSLVVEQTSFFSDENKVLDCFVENGRNKTTPAESSSGECKTPNRYVNPAKAHSGNEVTKSMFELNTFNS